MPSLLFLRDAIFALILLLHLMALRHVAATDYMVGDDDGWNTGTNYLAWSEKYNFTVGDVLVFRYLAGQHDVYQVTEETYRSCNSSSGVLRRYASGADRVPLEAATTYWFICNTSGHCLGGMKFGISVANSSSRGGVVEAQAPAQGGAAPRGAPVWLLGLTMGMWGLLYY
ncbi:Blue copper binding protein-like [Musa troglodytarum]|uniref:Blue copper binding protein-like n=1 Tax=Musa troglodytarum TaxID=320322 RepID=A0A9E7H6J6_9LILI|nr:Blue copper binding protein-like [Musa troglodytarum]